MDAFMLLVTIALCICAVVTGAAKAATSVADCIEKFDRLLRRRSRRK